MDNSNRHRHQQLPRPHQELHIVAVTDLLSHKIMTKTIATTTQEVMVRPHQQVETMEINRAVTMVVLQAVVATIQDPLLILIHHLEALHLLMEVALPHNKVGEVVMEDLHQEEAHMGPLRGDLQEEGMGVHQQMEIMGDKVVDITKVVAAMVDAMIMAVAVEAVVVEMVAGIVWTKTKWYRKTQSLSLICLTMQQKMLLRIILDKLV